MFRPRLRRTRGAALAAVVLGALASVPAAAAPATLAGPDGTTTPVCLALEGHDREYDVELPPATAERLYRVTPSYPGPCAVYSDPVPLGNGKIRTYAQLDGDRPLTLGYVFDATALENLPTENSDGRHCYDLNGDGNIDRDAECIHSHDYELELPAEFSERTDTPFTWALLGWDPHGHDPDGVYSLPHFDFHFYMQSKEGRDAIRTGPCGDDGLINCDDYATARKPVPERYTPADYADFGAVVAKMGNHLTDPTAPEFNGQKFTQTFMYGAYDGEITFYEPMITKEWLDEVKRENGDNCRPIKQPQAWKTGGWYPTSYCLEYRETRKDFTVSVKDFVHREAS